MTKRSTRIIWSGSAILLIVAVWLLAVHPAFVISLDHALWVLRNHRLSFDEKDVARSYIIERSDQDAVMRRVVSEIQNTHEVEYRGELFGVLQTSDTDESLEALTQLLASADEDVSIGAAAVLALRGDQSGREVLERALAAATDAGDWNRVNDLLEVLRVTAPE